jgi:hypothetical protein
MCRETASYQSLGEAERSGAPKAPWNPFGAYTVPVLVSFSDLISALASGACRPHVEAYCFWAVLKLVLGLGYFRRPGRASLIVLIVQG